MSISGHDLGLDGTAFEIEADSVQGARELAQLRVPDGCRAEIDVLCDGQPQPKTKTEIRASASSEGKARNRARGRMPSGLTVVSEHVIPPATRGTAVGSGADEVRAELAARRDVPKGMLTSDRKVTPLEFERSTVGNTGATNWIAAQRWVEELQAGLGPGHRVGNLRREPVAGRRLFGLLPSTRQRFVADIEKTTRVQVEIPYHSPYECVVVAGSDFFTPKARISVRIVRDEYAEAVLRSHPHLVADLARMPICNRSHSFFDEQYDFDHDLYVAPSREEPRILGPVRMAMRVVAFLERTDTSGRRTSPCYHGVGSDGVLHASFTTHYDDVPGGGNHVASLYVLRLSEHEYTDRWGRFQKG